MFTNKTEMKENTSDEKKINMTKENNVHYKIFKIYFLRLTKSETFDFRQVILYSFISKENKY